MKVRELLVLVLVSLVSLSLPLIGWEGDVLAPSLAGLTTFPLVVVSADQSDQRCPPSSLPSTANWAQDRHRDGKRWRKLQTFLSSDGTYPLFQSDPRRTSFLGPGSWPVYCLYNLSTSVPTRLHQAGSLCTRERRIEMIERKLVIPFNWDWLEEEALTNVSLGRPAPLRARDFSNCEMRQVLIHKMTRKQVMDDS